LYKEFNHLYIFNLRGDQRTLGEKSHKEGGKIFGSGSRTSVAISILVKDGSDKHELYYHDIGDYLSRSDKLGMISKFQNITGINWTIIVPDKNNDWLNQRDSNYQNYAEIVGDIFNNSAVGIGTSRDSWVIGFGKNSTLRKAELFINNYNSELLRLFNVTDYKNQLNRASTFIKWSRKLERIFSQKKNIIFNNNNIHKILYRPFTKKYIYFQPELVEYPGQYYKKFGNENLAIITTGKGVTRDFSALVTNLIADYHTMDTGQHFMRYDNEYNEYQMFYDKNNISETFAKQLDLSCDDIFAYVYGVLNSSEYQEKYANDLKKALARIPIVKDKTAYVKVGKALIDLHLNYETTPIYKDVKLIISDNPSYKVEKMKFGKTYDENGKSINDLSKIIFNKDIIVCNIPKKAYRYIINGRSAVEWIMDQYQIKVDTKSGHIDDPNEYSDDEKYIFELLLRIINVSVKTVEFVDSLPKFEVEG
jgi:endonuclease and methylase llaGI